MLLLIEARLQYFIIQGKPESSFANFYYNLTNSNFIFRACPSEFVIPLLKYRKSVYGIQLSIGMRFGMMFESEESGKRRLL